MKKEKLIRSRYIRELERFTNRIVDYFSKNDPTKEEMEKKVETIFKPLENIETTYLSSEYLKELEKFVQKYANIHLLSLDSQSIKENLLKEANLLRKLKRKKSFSKEKHRRLFKDLE